MTYLTAPLVLSLLLPPPSHRPDIGDRPDPRPSPSCNQRLVRECEQRHQAASENAARTAASMDPEIEARDRRAKELLAAKESYEARLRELGGEREMLSKEIDHAALQPAALSPPPLPGFPGLEDFFLLHSLEKSWAERYPAERAGKLRERREEAGLESAELEERYGRLSASYQSLSDQLSALRQHQSQLLADASTQARMKTTCYLSHCGPRD